MIIGIDLGTRFCCMGVYRNEKVEIIPNSSGKRTTPSFVSFENEEIIVGDCALQNKNVKNIIYDSKRLIGRNFFDKEIQCDIKHFPFKVTGDNQNILIHVDDKNYHPEEISSFILKKLRKDAEDYLGMKIDKAIITVPSYFNDKQREATKNAGELAGLNIVRMINEPTAAALAYGLDKNDDKCVLIFDLGGGTFDVTILNILNNTFIVKTTCGNTHLGGEDFDNRIVEYCFCEFVKKNNILDLKKLLENNKVKNKLKIEAENAKIILSSLLETTIFIEEFYEGKNLSVKLSRAKFEMLCESEFLKCFDPIKDALDSVSMKTSDISDVVLVGGSTKIPKIRDMIKNYFGFEPKCDINPDEAVAYGASIQAANMMCENTFRDLVLIDVASLSLGIETKGGLMSTIIPRNTRIPCTREQIFSTHSDYQPYVNIKIYEGERALVKDNNLLGEYKLCDISSKPRGEPRIIVKFKLDVNNILHVTARDETSNVIVNIPIEQIKKSNNEKILLMLQDAENNLQKDTIIKQKIENYSLFENFLYKTRNTILSDDFRSNATEENIIRLNELLNYYYQWINDNKNVELELLNEKYKEAENLILSLFINNIPIRNT